MSKVQILLVNPVRELTAKSGTKFSVQDAETVILDDTGAPIVVGPLGLPRELVGKVVPGVYDGTFQWERDYKTGRLVNNLLSLSPVKSAPAPAPAKA